MHWELFEIREQFGLRLIFPKHEAAVANAPWTKETLKYRSRVEDCITCETVSQGFKKFFNLGSGPLELQIGIEDIIKAAERKDLIASVKLDGSLLIRSVHKGNCMFRTRGSLGYSHLDNAEEMQLFYMKYPKLFEAGKYVGLSLLFEWVSPQNVIVIKYPEPELTLIGAVRHKDMSYLRIAELKQIAQDLEMPLVEAYPLSMKGWEELQKGLETSNLEGYVLRLNGEQDLVKVKAPAYLTKHALKSKLTSEGLADMYFQQGRPDFLTFCENFRNSFDEETTAWALGAICAMFDGVEKLRGFEDHIQRKARERVGLSRKEAALAGLAEYGQTKRFSAYMQAWEGKEIDTNLLKTVLLQNTKQVELGMFTKGEAE